MHSVKLILWVLITSILQLLVGSDKSHGSCEENELLNILNETKPELDSLVRERLIAATYVNESRCNHGSFLRLQILVQICKPEQPDLVDFLQECSTKQFQVCKNIFVEKFKEAEDRLDEEQKQIMHLLKVNLPKNLSQEGSAIIETLLSVISSMKERTEADLSDKSNFEQVFMEMLYNNFCGAYPSGLLSLNQVFNSVVEGQDFVFEMDLDTQRRIAITRICREVIMDTDRMVNQTHDLYLINRNKGGEWMIKKDKYTNN